MHFYYHHFPACIAPHIWYPHTEIANYHGRIGKLGSILRRQTEILKCEMGCQSALNILRTRK